MAISFGQIWLVVPRRLTAISSLPAFPESLTACFFISADCGKHCRSQIR